MPNIAFARFGGLNNVQTAHSSVFSQREDRGGSIIPAMLREATDVDLTDDGRVRVRPGAALSLATAAPQGAWAFGDVLVHQSGGGLYAGATALVSGLNPSLPISAVEHFGELYWCNGEVTGRILADGSAASWGLAVPPSPIVGAAGDYLLTATWFDAQGVESGAPTAVPYSLGASISLTPNEPAAVGAHLYISTLDGDELFLAKTVLLGDFPTSLATARASLTRLQTLHMIPPPATIAGVSAFKRVLLVWENQWVYPSTWSPQMFAPLHGLVYELPHRVLHAQGVDGGVWVTTEGGLFWIDTGSEMPLVVRKDSRDYALGGALVDGHNFPELRTDRPVAVFASDAGLVFGLPDGSANYATLGVYEFGDVTDKRASFAFAERDDLKQLVVAVN